MSSATLSFTLLLVGACASSAPDNEHGPSYNIDSGSGSTDGALLDGTTGEGGRGDGSAPDGAGSDGGSSSTDGAGDDGPNDGGDDGGPAPGDAGCMSTMTLFAMGTSNIVEAHYAGGSWSIATIVSQGGAALPAQPSLVAFGSDFLAAFAASGASMPPLDWTLYTGSWTAAAHVGSATAQGTPALAELGGTAHVVYWGSDGKYYHGRYSGTSWDNGLDALEVEGGAQSFGSSGPAAAAVGSSTLVVAQAGTNGLLYDQSWTASGWQAANGHSDTSVVPTLSPAIVALQGGAADLMVAYVRASDANDDHLEYTTRSSGTWSSPSEVYDMPGMVAASNATPALAPLPNGGAVLVWQAGSPAMPYASVYAPATGWAAPTSISNVPLASPPSVAAGPCGTTAVATFVLTSGQVNVSTLTGTAWSTPIAIVGATGMQSVAIASRP